MTRGRALLLLSLLCASCTFGGLGNYTTETCPSPTGSTSTVQAVGTLGATADLTFSSTKTGAIGTYVAAANGGLCVQAVGRSGYLASGCAFFASSSFLAPRQPWAVPMGGGRAVAAIAATAPCTQGQLTFEYDDPSLTPSPQSAGCDPAGASLPSLAPLGQSTALVAWYKTAVSTIEDPIQSCSSAKGAPLVVAAVSDATGTAASVGTPITLTSDSRSVRPAAMLQVGSEVVVVAPSGSSVSVWAFNGSAPSAPAPVTVAGLAGARAVSAATDGNGKVAIVAEIGCAPQSIALAVGTLRGGFDRAISVAAKGSSLAVQPTIAWVASQSAWVVGWIATDGGPHALGRRFDANGGPMGAVIDPGAPATGATVMPDGNLLAYEPTTQSFVTASLGCVE